jgi:TolB protein
LSLIGVQVNTIFLRRMMFIVALLMMILTTDCSTLPPPPPPSAPTATANVLDISRVTNDQAPEIKPKVSPDGTQILFTTFNMTKRDFSGFSIVLLQNGVAGRHLVAGPFARDPAWSPDGNKFIYQYLKMDHPIFVKTPTAGVGMTFISPQAFGDCDGQPDYSPDGERIAFKTKIGNSWQICCVNTDGRDFTIYTEGSHPCWHPDGNKLAFDRLVGKNAHCFIIDLRNGQVTQLTRGDSYNVTPSWSPDGDWISFISNRDGKEHLFAMRADGSDVSQLTTGETQEAFPDWSSNNFIYFSSNAGAPKAQPIDPSNWNYANIWRLTPVLPE